MPKFVSRTDIINHLIKRFDYKNYLEIGIADGANFVGVEGVDYWTGVDPDPQAYPGLTHRMTSDEFFEENTEIFDIVFIDGLHHHGQAYRDALNALKCLDVLGTVVMHDCSPPDKAHQIVPREQLAWCGDVWRAFLQLREIKELHMEVIGTDYGVGIIQPSGVQIPLPDYTFRDMTYEAFDENRTSLLNLKPADVVLGRDIWNPLSITPPDVDAK